jgi:hypothetical protein
MVIPSFQIPLFLVRTKTSAEDLGRGASDSPLPNSLIVSERGGGEVRLRAVGSHGMNGPLHLTPTLLPRKTSGEGLSDSPLPNSLIVRERGGGEVKLRAVIAVQPETTTTTA